MTGYCNEVNVYLKIADSNFDDFTSLLKQYGSRNLHFYQLGFDNLKTLEEILDFLQYKFKIEQGYLIIYEFYGHHFGIDPQMWTLAGKKIECGYFKLSNDNIAAINLRFENGKVTIIDDLS